MPKGLKTIATINQSTFIKFFVEVKKKIICNFCKRDVQHFMTSGWHSINAIHVNENWLGYDASRKTVTKRVMNFYLYYKGLFREN